MPCRDEGAAGAYAGELQVKLDKVTRLLCAVCKYLEENGDFDTLRLVESGKLDTWWQEHKWADARREAQEAEDRRLEDLKRKALRKLTKEERRLLGIKD